jgi:gamma-glutamyltranspeptidase/glutathione hydrolase
VLKPAISYAKGVHPLVERASATIATVRNLFVEHCPTSAAVFLNRGDASAPGTMFVNLGLAAIYERILAESSGGDREAEIERARKIWSQGFVAEAIDRFCRTQEMMDVTARRHGGFLRGDGAMEPNPRAPAGLWVRLYENANIGDILTSAPSLRCPA